MKNPIVLTICNAEYDAPLSNLESVRGDLARFRDIFERDYHFSFYPQRGDKYDNKFRWTRREIYNFITGHRQKLIDSEDDEKKHQSGIGGKKDGMIVIFRGHGDNGKILSSTGKGWEIAKIHDWVSSKWNKSAERVPRLFIIDACRGQNEMVQSKDDKDDIIKEVHGPSSDNKQDEDEEEEDGDDAPINLERNLVMTIYGNPVGYATYGYTESGGALSQAVITTLKENRNHPQDFSDLLVEMNHILKQKQQLVNNEGDPSINKLQILPNKPPFPDRMFFLCLYILYLFYAMTIRKIASIFLCGFVFAI